MRKNEKIRYEIDPFNRVIIPRFRTILDGEFRVSKNNLLCYRVKAPSSSPPQQLKLSGNWTLDKDHNLMLILDKENNQRQGDKLTLTGEIIDAKADELTFSLATKDCSQGTHFYLLKLGGRWQVDEYNRLNFLVSKETDIIDTLTFLGSWEVDRHNQIIYTYTQAGLKTKDKLTRLITFKGFWDINEKNRISYVLNKEIGSRLDFRVSLGKPVDRGLQYEIGIGAGGARKKILLFGAWKLNERLGLTFEMPVEGGKNQEIILGATCKLNKDYNLELKLKNNRHEDMGMDLKLSRTFLKGLGQAYIEALKEGREISLVAGIGFRW